MEALAGRPAGILGTTGTFNQDKPHGGVIPKLMMWIRKVKIADLQTRTGYKQRRLGNYKVRGAWTPLQFCDFESTKTLGNAIDDGCGLQDKRGLGTKY